MGSRKTAVALTFAVTVAACGAGETTDIARAPASTESTAPVTTVGAQSSDPEATPAAAEGPVAPIVSAFPELVVADVASGDQITLRQAAGTGTPVAMWFWFPH